MEKSLNLRRLWRHMEDVLFPALRLSTHERALYFHLLRYSRLENRRHFRVSRNELARAVGLCSSTARHYLRTLARKQCVRFLERNSRGCQLEVFLPEEILDHLAHSAASKELVCAGGEVERDAAGQPRAWPRTDHFRSSRFRARILHREGNRCFYCRQLLQAGAWALDHVIPVSQGGDSASSNLVASCYSCNSQKGQVSAKDFVASLRTKGVITSVQAHSLKMRLRALSA